MEANERMLYSELRTIQGELVARLQSNEGSDLIRPLIIEELKDVTQTLEKLKNGTFGRCEISGELLPEECLMSIPTIKTIHDLNVMKRFYCKTIYS